MITATCQTDLLNDRKVWVIALDNSFSGTPFTLLISKISEAVLPETDGNHIGEGAAMDDFIVHQSGVRFIINGGFSHYRKDFYHWPHQDFNVGDPVGLTKIREHYYEDLHDIDSYGFFVEETKGTPWKIVRHDTLKRSEKYILGCTPLLIFDRQPIPLPLEKMTPLEPGKITPPSVLAHGLENHPRTAVGLKDNQIVFIVVEGDDTTGGCTLPELQTVGEKLALDSFMNLDGGGSTQFRLWHDEGAHYTSNNIAPKDRNRVLGHVIVLFDERLKPLHANQPKTTNSHHG